MSSRPRVARGARVKAQAKVNLFLAVGAAGQDGYHELFTLFQRLDLADDVVVMTDTSDRSLRCSGPAMPAGGLGAVDENLAYRAAQAYTRATGWETGFSVEVIKHIPVGGGLGGGSADAAAVLRALEALSPNPLGERALVQVGRTLGADVAFLCTSLPTCFATGRGDVLMPALSDHALEPRDVLLLVPPFSISTAEAYRWIDAERPVSALNVPPFTAQGSDWSMVEQAAAQFGNDFEPVVDRRHPVL